MKEKNKGFTLVELLAVIVILAIIALIATPIILNVINDAKKQAALESLKGYIDGAEKAIALNELEDEEDPTFPKPDDSGCYDLNKLAKKINIKGTKPTIDNDVKVCFQNGEVTSISGLAFSGYEVGYKKGKGYEINGEVVEKDDNKEIASKEYTQGEKVNYLGYKWLVMKDNGDNTQLIMDGYLSDKELDENYPTDIDQSFKSKKYYFCLFLGTSAEKEGYAEEKSNFLSKVGNYCYAIWDGKDNGISAYTWNKSITKKILENWIDSKMTEKGLNKATELKGMAFTDGIEQTTGYIRIPTYNEVNPNNVYNIKTSNNYMAADYDYLTLTGYPVSGNFQSIYVYFKWSDSVYIVEMGGIASGSETSPKIRPVITVNEK